MNVLLTCAGRRNYLVRYFRDALAGEGRVLAADANPDAPALAEADRAFVVPLVSDPNGVTAVVDLCRDEAVDLLVSLNDFELPVLAENRERFVEIGTIPVVASPDVVEACFDKWATVQFLRGIGVDAPATYLSIADARVAIAAGELEFPVVVKPRWGTASIGIDVARDDAELGLLCELGTRRLAKSGLPGRAVRKGPAVIIQEQLRGDEHGVDIVNDLEGNYVTTFARRKLAMRGGETDRAVTVADPALSEVGARVGAHTRHIGLMDTDVFLQAGRATVLELNPRFGGGYPFSHIAGANVPAALVAWAAGRSPDPDWLVQRIGIRCAKFDDIVVTG